MNPLLTVAVVWGVGEAGDESFLQGDEAPGKRKFSPFCYLQGVPKKTSLLNFLEGL